MNNEDAEVEELSLHDRFEHFNGDFIKFERIAESDRLHPNRQLCGLLKLASLMVDPSKFDFCAEHDELFLCGDRKVKPLSDLDIIYLLRCGIRHDASNCCFATFT